MRDSISTPIPQGTLYAKVVWDNETERDGIEISLMRRDGSLDVLCTVAASDRGLTYDMAIPIDDLDPSISLEVSNDEEAGFLHLESREADGHEEHPYEGDGDSDR